MSSDATSNLARIREGIERAASRAGRRGEEITLVAVSKMHPAGRIRALYEAGVRHFGENRVQEWESKHASLADLDATWHMIGHLQGNKAARAVRMFHTIDSVDSIALAERLDRTVEEFNTALQGRNETQLQRLKPNSRSYVLAGLKPGPPKTGQVSLHQAKRSNVGSTEGTGNTEKREEARGAGREGQLRVLIEVKLDPEAAKSGVNGEELPRLVEAVLRMPHLELRGLLGVPPYFDDEEKARPYFRRLRELRDAIRTQMGPELLPVLSMGMSHDFEAAIEEGATEVRIGTALFGERRKA